MSKQIKQSSKQVLTDSTKRTLAIVNIVINTLFSYFIHAYVSPYRYQTTYLLAEICLHFLDFIIFIGFGFATSSKYMEILIFALRKYCLLMTNTNLQICIYGVLICYFGHMGACAKKQRYYWLVVAGLIACWSGLLSYGLIVIIINLLIQYNQSRIGNIVTQISLLFHLTLFPTLTGQIKYLTIFLTLMTIYQLNNYSNILQIYKKMYLNYYFFIIILIGEILISQNIYQKINQIWFIMIVWYFIFGGLIRGKIDTMNIFGRIIFQENSNHQIIQNKNPQSQKVLLRRPKIPYPPLQQVTRADSLCYQKFHNILPFGIFYSSILLNYYNFNPFPFLISIILFQYHTVTYQKWITLHSIIGLVLSIAFYYHNNFVTPHIKFPQSVNRYLYDHTCYSRNLSLLILQILVGFICLLVLILSISKYICQILRLVIKLFIPILLGFQIWNMGCFTYQKMIPIICLIITVFVTLRKQRVPIEESESEDNNSDSSNQP